MCTPVAVVTVPSCLAALRGFECIKPPAIEKRHPRSAPGVFQPQFCLVLTRKSEESTGPSLSPQGEDIWAPTGSRTSVSPQAEDISVPTGSRTTSVPAGLRKPSQGHFSKCLLRSKVCSSWTCLQSHHFHGLSLPCLPKPRVLSFAACRGSEASFNSF